MSRTLVKHNGNISKFRKNLFAFEYKGSSSSANLRSMNSLSTWASVFLLLFNGMRRPSAKEIEYYYAYMNRHIVKLNFNKHATIRLQQAQYGQNMGRQHNHHPRYYKHSGMYNWVMSKLNKIHRDSRIIALQIHKGDELTNKHGKQKNKNKKYLFLYWFCQKKKKGILVLSFSLPIVPISYSSKMRNHRGENQWNLSFIKKKKPQK